MATLNRPRAFKVEEHRAYIESDDDDQQHTNGASVPVQALDRDANGVPLDATVINARGCKRRGGRRTSSAVSTVPSHTHLGSGSMSSAMK
ncbi:hypothetical protein D6D24_05877 [Aureobasidium pullulans]|uniref:Uncharacterized protein n=1 Tax=Aureobasidium pullulans TaxID=5580 RepID=A0A4S8VNK5_AURPU|nr:hypothetical protein D6D24_05877 [Aureobasidium pullulans]